MKRVQEGFTSIEPTMLPARIPARDPYRSGTETRLLSRDRLIILPAGIPAGWRHWDVVHQAQAKDRRN